MEKIQKTLFWSIIASESMHVFCCVLPTIVSVISLLAGVGALSFLPGIVLDLHEVLHRWEVPMIVLSGVILAVGWVLYYASRRIDCHDEAGCTHGPCSPKKNITFKVMVFATALFAFNVLVYLSLHYGHNNF